MRLRAIASPCLRVLAASGELERCTRRLLRVLQISLARFGDATRPETVVVDVKQWLTPEDIFAAKTGANVCRLVHCGVDLPMRLIFVQD